MRKFDLCFADLVNTNHDKSLNIDNIVLLIIYDALRENITPAGVRNIINKLRREQKCSLTNVKQLIKELLRKYSRICNKDDSESE